MIPRHVVRSRSDVAFGRLRFGEVMALTEVLCSVHCFCHPWSSVHMPPQRSALLPRHMAASP